MIYGEHRQEIILIVGYDKFATHTQKLAPLLLVWNFFDSVKFFLLLKCHIQTQQHTEEHTFFLWTWLMDNIRNLSATANERKTPETDEGKKRNAVGFHESSFIFFESGNHFN